ncbi:MAG TPA: sugar phosphate isomerase/epimerase family protein [Bryobacteraceae bacterium]|jgi:sugar phosphate isomerase/epimerase
MRRREFVAALTAAGLNQDRLLRGQSSTHPPFRTGIVPANSGRQTSAEDTYWSNCDAVAALGFHFVEFNDTRSGIVEAWSSRAGEFREKMTKRHLTFAGAALFSHMADSTKTRELIDRHMLLGKFLRDVGGAYITHMIAPGTVLNEPADDSEYAQLDVGIWAEHANEIGKRLANEFGVSLAYHPEQGEIRRGLHESILDATEDRWLRLLIDTGHVASAGYDAVAIVKQYRTRLVCIHLKDFSSESHPRKPGNVSLGTGAVNIQQVVGFLRDTGFAGWVMAESGGTNEHMRDYMSGRLGLVL